jgi:hypothetical protein
MNKSTYDILMDNLKEYYSGIDINNVIFIKTKEIKTPYLSRKTESFYAIRLPYRELPGLPEKTSLRIISLNAESPVISVIPLDWIHSIDGKEISQKKEWTIEGSKGKIYTIKLNGDRYSCNCPAYIFGRGKPCKHIKEITNG